MVKITKLDDIEIYKEAIILANEIFKLCKNSQLSKEYSLCDQVKRASVSVAANIAEGYGRNTRRDFAQFLSISLGSSNEVIALLDIINLTYPNANVLALKEKYILLCKRTFSFRKYISS